MHGIPYLLNGCLVPESLGLGGAESYRRCCYQDARRLLLKLLRLRQEDASTVGSSNHRAVSLGNPAYSLKRRPIGPLFGDDR